MKSEAEAKWHSRLLRKRAIEQDIAEFTADLEDAARSFQVSERVRIWLASCLTKGLDFDFNQYTPCNRRQKPVGHSLRDPSSIYKIG